jgi:hypothetical protein
MKRACLFPRASVAKAPSALGCNLRPLWGQQAIDESWTSVSMPWGGRQGWRRVPPDKYQALNCQVAGVNNSSTNAGELVTLTPMPVGVDDISWD